MGLAGHWADSAQCWSATRRASAGRSGTRRIGSRDLHCMSAIMYAIEYRYACVLSRRTSHSVVVLRVLLRRLWRMLLEVDRRGRAKVEVEELRGGQVVEVAVVDAEVVLRSLLLVRGNGVQVGEVCGHVGRPTAGEVGHGRCRNRRW